MPAVLGRSGLGGGAAPEARPVQALQGQKRFPNQRSRSSTVHLVLGNAPPRADPGSSVAQLGGRTDLLLSPSSRQQSPDGHVEEPRRYEARCEAARSQQLFRAVHAKQERIFGSLLRSVKQIVLCR